MERHRGGGTARSMIRPSKQSQSTFNSPPEVGTGDTPLSRIGAANAALHNCGATYLPPSSRLPQEELCCRCKWPSMSDPDLPNADVPMDDSDKDDNDDEKMTAKMTEMMMMPETPLVRFSGSTPLSLLELWAQLVADLQCGTDRDGQKGGDMPRERQQQQDCTFNGSSSLGSTSQHQLSSLILVTKQGPEDVDQNNWPTLSRPETDCFLIDFDLNQ
ncbi:unnamed protein product [Linum tenue]|uniref:Uncharacterized protein n=1 Tax=Linum tenue TaxID=586396 RepID=A0AAV0L7E9_9ROSI|nr:unnamed protein product [Linum tenue]